MGEKNKLKAIKVGMVVVINVICLFSIFYFITTGIEKKQAISEEVTVINKFESSDQGSQASSAPVKPSAPYPTASPDADIVIIDDFEKGGGTNKLGSRTNIYVRPPSRVMLAKRDEVISGKETKVLMIKYEKKNTGGPSGLGGWCGYYTLLKNPRTSQYFDASNYSLITFWVKGEEGGENFMIGLADEHWDRMGDSLKSEEVGVYLEKGRITTEWQKAKIPLNVFFLDYASLSSVSINFEADCYPEGAGSGGVLIDDIALEK